MHGLKQGDTMSIKEWNHIGKISYINFVKIFPKVEQFLVWISNEYIYSILSDPSIYPKAECSWGRHKKWIQLHTYIHTSLIDRSSVRTRNRYIHYPNSVSNYSIVLAHILRHEVKAHLSFMNWKQWIQC